MIPLLFPARTAGPSHGKLMTGWAVQRVSCRSRNEEPPPMFSHVTLGTNDIARAVSEVVAQYKGA